MLQQILQYQKKGYIYFVSCFLENDKLEAIRAFSTGNLPAKHCV